MATSMDFTNILTKLLGKQTM